MTDERLVAQSSDAEPDLPHTEEVHVGLFLLLALAIAVAGAVRLRRHSGGTSQGTLDSSSGSAGSPGISRASRPSPASIDGSVPIVDSGLVDDLDAAFDRVLAEHGHELGDLLQLRLDSLVARKVPVRAIRAAPGRHCARVHFADGTVVLAHGQGRGEFSLIVRGMHTGAVNLAGYTREVSATRLDLRTRTGARVHLLAVGLDQPD